MRERECFSEYVGQYDQTDPKITLKFEHSLRVSDLCEELALRLGMDFKDVVLAKQIGLLHDIGRFPQVACYGTFVDAHSVSHAQLSLQVLFEEGWIRYFIKDSSDDQVIDRAIRYHSDRYLPNKLTPRENIFCHLLRDADKIDILRVHQQHTYNDFLNCDSQALAASKISDEVLHAFLQQRTVDFKKRETPLDILLSHDALIFDLHYEESKQLFKEKEYRLLSIIEGISFREEETRDRLRIIMDVCQKYGFITKEIL